MLHDGTQEALLEKPGGAITKLQFNDGTSLDVKENEIVLFVGPNNAGKSQALKDIYALSNEKIESSVVVRDITLTKRAAPTIPFLKGIATMEDEGSYKIFTGMNGGCNSYHLDSFTEEYGYGAMRFLFVAYLSTLDRLTICEPPRPVSRNEPKTHPIHYVMFESTYRKWLSENFRKAFGKSLMLHWRFGEVIPLCIGEPVQLEADYPDEDARGEAYGEILNAYPQVQNQGDGIKSFVGILLYLMLDHFCTFLIDEPESFLHPPQAKIMGL